MVIIVSNTKGGVGKSTLAVHLAVWLYDRGCAVAFVDTDEQETAAGWLSVAEPNLSLHIERDPKSLVSLVKQLDREHDFVVCDTEGSYGFVGTLLPSRADLAVIPLQPSEADVDELDKALYHIQVAQQSRGRPAAALVLSMTAPNDARSRRLRGLLSQIDLPIARQTIRRLNATRDVAKRGVVTRGTTAAERNAAQDFERLFRELLRGKLPTKRGRAANG